MKIKGSLAPQPYISPTMQPTTYIQTVSPTLLPTQSTTFRPTGKNNIFDTSKGSNTDGSGIIIGVILSLLFIVLGITTWLYYKNQLKEKETQELTRPPLGGEGPFSTLQRIVSGLPCHGHWLAIKTPNPKWPLARIAIWPKMPQST